MMGWPGIKTDSTWPSDTTPGYISFKASAARVAFFAPPSRQSLKSNSGCLTGFENDTDPLSTKVIFRTPQPFMINHVSFSGFCFFQSKASLPSNCAQHSYLEFQLRVRGSL